MGRATQLQTVDPSIKPCVDRLVCQIFYSSFGSSPISHGWSLLGITASWMYVQAYIKNVCLLVSNRHNKKWYQWISGCVWRQSKTAMTEKNQGFVLFFYEEKIASKGIIMEMVTASLSFILFSFLMGSSSKGCIIIVGLTCSVLSLISSYDDSGS